MRFRDLRRIALAACAVCVLASSIADAQLLDPRGARAPATTESGQMGQRPQPGRTPDVLNVKDFGARGLSGGARDDGPAISSVCAYIRRNVVVNGPTASAYTVFFPDDVYPVATSINCTLLRGLQGVVFSGPGAVLLGRTNRHIVMDMLGSVHITIRDLRFFGDTRDTPSIGLAMGRFDEANHSDQQHLDGVSFYGNYTRAAAYFNSTETSQDYSTKFWNGQGGGSYGVIFDGMSHFNPGSVYVTQTLGTDVAASFNEMTSIGMDVRVAPGAAAAVFLGTGARHRWVGSYIAGGGVEMFYPAGGGGMSMADLDVHMEVGGGALAYSFWITGGGTRGAHIEGFHYRDHAPQTTTNIIGVDPAFVAGGDLFLENLDLELGATGVDIFNMPAKIFGTGRVSIGSHGGVHWNGLYDNFAITLLADGRYSVIGTNLATIPQIGTSQGVTMPGSLATTGFIQQGLAGPLTASGRDQAGATELAAQASFVTVAALGQGVRLPQWARVATATAAPIVVVWNETAVRINVYPEAGGQFFGLAVNAPYALAPGHTGQFWMINKTTVKVIADQ